MVLDHCEDAWALAFPRLRAGMLSAELRDAESGPYFIDDCFRESQQVIFARPGSEQRLLAGGPFSFYLCNYPSSRIPRQMAKVRTFSRPPYGTRPPTREHELNSKQPK
jgi:hypothetical protein